MTADENKQDATGADDDVVWTEGGELSDLLGFDLGEEPGVDRSGLHALINSALVSHRRLPMLDVIFDRTARRMSTSLRQLTDENVEVTLENVTSTRFGDLLAQDKLGVLGVVHSKFLDGHCLLTAEAGLVYSVVDLLLGGRRAAVETEYEGRDFTAIELGLAQRMLSLLIADFDHAFEPVCAAEFTLDRIETTPRFATIAQEASVCALAKFRVRIDDVSGGVSILIPHAALEPVIEQLRRDFISDSNGASEAAWKERLVSEATTANIEVSAVIADQPMTIGEVSKLTPGATMTFPISKPVRIELRAGDVPIGAGRVGRSGEVVAIKLDEALEISPEKEDAA